MKQIFVITMLVVLGLWSSVSLAQDYIWDLQSVNALGQATHPKVGADVGSDPATSPNRVTIEGIALNANEEYLNPDEMWQIFVQAEPPDRGGIAAWAGIFYNRDWPRYPTDIQPGDRIRIIGFAADRHGKVLINERHSAAPGMQFVVTILARNVGMPDPIEIPNLAACNFFDPMRDLGGELYQAQWVRLSNVWIESGAWGAGNQLVIRDISDATLTLHLSDRGDFNLYSAPRGTFNVVGLFNQEDPTPPFHHDYRIWVKNYGDIELSTSAENWEMYY